MVLKTTTKGPKPEAARNSPARKVPAVKPLLKKLLRKPAKAKFVASKTIEAAYFFFHFLKISQRAC